MQPLIYLRNYKNDKLTQLELESTLSSSAKESAKTTVYENQAFYVETISAYVSEQKLWIEDFALEPISIEPEGDVFRAVYQLFVLEKGQTTSLFMNYLGKSVISLQVGKKFYYSSFDVRSNKINPENYIRILELVENRFPGSIIAPISLTEINSNVSSEGQVLKRPMIRHAAAALDNLDVAIDMVISKPRSQLSKRYSTAIQANANTFIDDQCLSWIISNPSCLVPVNRLQEDIIRIGNRNFQPQNIVRASYFDDTNTYENQILRGIVESIRGYLSNLKQLYQRSINSDVENTEESAELTFSRIVKILTARSYQPLIQEINRLIQICTRQLSKLENSLSVFKGIQEVPELTPSFRNVHAYEHIFQIAQDWYENYYIDHGDIVTSHPVESIAKIYELFCLSKIIDSITAIGFSATDTEDGLEPIRDQYTFIKSDGTVCRLFYDKVVKSPQNVINSDELVDTQYTGRLRPDFVVNFTNVNGLSVNIIADAKFTNARNARKTYLEALTFKYLHRFSTKKGGFSNILGLMICYPDMMDDNSDSDYDLCKNDYSISGDLSKLPFLVTRSIGFRQNGNVSSLLDKCANYDLYEILENTSTQENFSAIHSGRAQSRSTQLTEHDASVIKGMILRGDHSQDIAAWFGVNQGRIAEIKKGDRFPGIAPIPTGELPPSGPYPGIKDFFEEGTFKPN